MIKNVRLIILIMMVSFIDGKQCLAAKLSNETETHQICDQLVKTNLKPWENKTFYQSDLDAFEDYVTTHVNHLQFIRVQWTNSGFKTKEIGALIEESRRDRLNHLITFINTTIARDGAVYPVDFFTCVDEIPFFYGCLEKEHETNLIALGAKVPLLQSCITPAFPLTLQGVMIPDFFLINAKTQEQITQLLTGPELLQPFHERENKIFWRGSLSGHELKLTSDYKTKNPRLNLILLSKETPVIEAKLTSLLYVDVIAFADDKQKELVRQWVGSNDCSFCGLFLPRSI